MRNVTLWFCSNFWNLLKTKWTSVPHCFSNAVLSNSVTLKKFLSDTIWEAIHFLRNGFGHWADWLSRVQGCRKFKNLGGDRLTCWAWSGVGVGVGLSTDYGHPMKALIKEIWKFGLMWQTKYAKNLGVGVDFRPCGDGDFLTGRP